MYFVKYGKEFLHDPRSSDYLLVDLSLDCEENSCGYCDFTIYPSHPMYNKLKEHDAVNQVEVYDGDILLFSGFIYELGIEFYLDGHVKCKGELDYLRNSIVRPYSTKQRGFGDKAPADPNGYFRWIIEQHNSQVDENRRFNVGINQGNLLGNGKELEATNDSFPTSIEEISSILLNSDIGGYLSTRHVNGKRYIDYISEWKDSNTQLLDFGVNLTDYTQTDDSSELATFVVPYGAKLSETEYDYNDGHYLTSDQYVDESKEYYTHNGKPEDEDYDPHSFSAVNDLVNSSYYMANGNRVDTDWYYNSNGDKIGTTTDEMRHTLERYERVEVGEDTYTYERIIYYDYVEEDDESDLPLTLDRFADVSTESTEYLIRNDTIYSDISVNRYGWIGFAYSNNDIKTKEDLIKEGIIALKEKESPKRTIEIKAVDMHMLNPDMKPIRIGEYVRVRSMPHNLDSFFLCASIELDLNNPGNSLYTLGTTFDTLTGQQNKRINELNAQVDKLIEKAKRIRRY